MSATSHTDDATDETETEARTTDSDALAFDERTVRAAGEPLDLYQHSETIFHVYSEGDFYVVDVRDRRCECPDHKYRGGECKHLQRVALARGDREIPPGVNVDPVLEKQRAALADESRGSG